MWDIGDLDPKDKSSAEVAESPILSPAPKRRISREEDRLHESVADILSRVIALPGELSPDGVVWWSVEHRSVRHGSVASAIEGHRRKRRGVIGGIPDLNIRWAGRVLDIELKRPTKGKVSTVQKSLHKAIRGAGGAVEIAHSLDDVIKLLQEYRVPHRACR